MFSPEAIEAAKRIRLPDITEEFTLTEYDKKIWQEAFDWYNKTLKPEKQYTLTCKHCYSKVYISLRQAQKA